MSVTELRPPVLVEDGAGLKTLIRALSREPRLAVDTESNSLFAYRERVCLIQFSIPSADYILDPLRFSDLSALAPLFASTRQEKIFHAAEYDLIGLRRDYGFEFNNLFDTMIAARTLGWPQVGLAAILQTHFGVKMDKRYQRANWGQRPLSREQLDYARLDTHYLPQLRDLLHAQLAAEGRLEEAREEFDRFARMSAEGPANNTPGFWRVTGARDLSPRQASVLRELYQYREQQAERADRPPFKIMGDATLMEIVRRNPKSAAQLQKIPGMTPAQMRRHAEALLRAVQAGLAAPPAHPPAFAREPDEVRERYDRLHQWRKQKAQKRGVESDVILPRDALWELARRAPRSAGELEEIAHLGPWRRQTYGAEILQILNPKR